jgi:hypothetical protein
MESSSPFFVYQTWHRPDFPSCKISRPLISAVFHSWKITGALILVVFPFNKISRRLTLSGQQTVQARENRGDMLHYARGATKALIHAKKFRSVNKITLYGHKW